MSPTDAPATPASLHARPGGAAKPRPVAGHAPEQGWSAGQLSSSAHAPGRGRARRPSIASSPELPRLAGRAPAPAAEAGDGEDADDAGAVGDDNGEGHGAARDETSAECDDDEDGIDDDEFSDELLDWLINLTPAEIVAELDKYIVGQSEAKKAVAVALRNRWRRQKVKDTQLREEIFPNNLIMIGPTGVGKTEIARRMARLSGSPFVKVEASKFTEVGYVGRDAEAMIRDLADTAVNMVRNEREEEMAPEARRRAEERLLDLLLPDSAEKPRKRAGRRADPDPERPDKGGDKEAPGAAGGGDGDAERRGAAALDEESAAAFLAGKDGVARRTGGGEDTAAPRSGASSESPLPPGEAGAGDEQSANAAEAPADADEPESDDRPMTDRLARTREKLRALLRKGELENRMVEMETRHTSPLFDAMTNPGGRMEDVDVHFTETLRDMLPKQTKQRTVTVAEARRFLFSDELDQLVDTQDVIFDAMDRVEESGIVFLDEIDKIAAPQRGAGPDVSREGVQRDLLPVVEGCNVQTKYGLISTEHILFIAAGAFHVSKPSDLIPEIQGRFPIRVELRSLDATDFVRILKEPHNSLIRQYAALIQVEDATVTFTDDGLEEIARVAAELNERMENIGARRLQTVLISVMEKMMFGLPEEASDWEVDAAFVRARLQPVVSDSDLSRYIL